MVYGEDVSKFLAMNIALVVNQVVQVSWNLSSD